MKFTSILALFVSLKIIFLSLAESRRRIKKSKLTNNDFINRCVTECGKTSSNQIYIYRTLVGAQSFTCECKQRNNHLGDAEGANIKIVGLYIDKDPNIIEVMPYVNAENKRDMRSKAVPVNYRILTRRR